MLAAAVVVLDALVTTAVVDVLGDSELVTIVVLLEATELVVLTELLDVPVVVGAGATTSRDNAQYGRPVIACV